MTLYEYIVEQVDKKNLTLGQFLHEANLTYNTIYNLRKRKPSMTTYQKIAKVLDVDVGELRCYPISNND